MPIDWWSKEQRPFTIMILLGLVGILLSEGGYRLGWWNDAHLSGLVVSALTLALGVVATWLLSASRSQAQGIREDVRQVGQEVREARRAIVTHQEQQTAVLMEIRDRLPR